MFILFLLLLQGKPTDFNYNNGTSLINGSSTNIMMNNSAANAGRTNFTNKQLTVMKTTKKKLCINNLFFLSLGIRKRISF